MVVVHTKFYFVKRGWARYIGERCTWWFGGLLCGGLGPGWVQRTLVHRIAVSQIVRQQLISRCVVVVGGVVDLRQKGIGNSIMN